MVKNKKKAKTQNSMRVLSTRTHTVPLEYCLQCTKRFSFFVMDSLLLIEVSFIIYQTSERHATVKQQYY